MSVTFLCAFQHFAHRPYALAQGVQETQSEVSVYLIEAKERRCAEIVFRNHLFLERGEIPLFPRGKSALDSEHPERSCQPSRNG